MTSLTAQGAQRRVEDLLQSSGALPRLPFADVGDALAVVHPGGGQHSWLVPLVGDEGSMVGFVEISPAGTLIRASEFGEAQSLTTWTDVGEIRESAAGHIGKGETVGEPVLTYDAVPSRICWAVPVTVDGEPVATVYIAGVSSYRRDLDEPADTGVGGFG